MAGELLRNEEEIDNVTKHCLRSGSDRVRTIESFDIVIDTYRSLMAACLALFTLVFQWLIRGRKCECEHREGLVFCVRMFRPNPSLRNLPE